MEKEIAKIHQSLALSESTLNIINGHCSKTIFIELQVSSARHFVKYDFKYDCKYFVSEYTLMSSRNFVQR